MGQISAHGLPAWIITRILAYFNRATTVKDITEGMLKDDPATGTGKYAIGEVVAQRILDQRNTFPGHRFTEIEQLNGILGLGEDKFHDLVFTFGVPAAEAFKAAMYANVIAKNWILEAHTTQFDVPQEMMDLVNTPETFRKWLAEQLGTIATQKYNLKNGLQTAKKLLKASCPQVFESGHVASYALALWFYRFDADNWFNFDAVHQEAELYLDFMSDPRHRAELYMFRGFRNAGFIAQPVTVTDLPVVVNYAENEITIWTAQLND